MKEDRPVRTAVPRKYTLLIPGLRQTLRPGGSDTPSRAIGKPKATAAGAARGHATQPSRTSPRSAASPAKRLVRRVLLPPHRFLLPKAPTQRGAARPVDRMTDRAR